MRTNIFRALPALLALGMLAVQPALAQTYSKPLTPTAPTAPTAPPASSAESSAAPAPPAQSLTAEQLAKVKSVLAGYKSATLTVEDAKTIKSTFRDAGIRPGPAIDKALSDLGFSAARLDVLAPPPPRPAGPAGISPSGPPPAR